MKTFQRFNWILIPILMVLFISCNNGIEDSEIVSEKYNVTFNVFVGNSGLDGVSISINNSIITTNNNGIAVIELIDGNYDYTTTLSGYNTNTGSLTVNGSDTAENITMILTPGNGTLSTAVFTTTPDVTGYGIVYYQNNYYYSNGNNKIEIYNQDGDYDSVFASYPNNNFTSGSCVYNNILYILGTIPDENAHPAISRFDFDTGILNTIDIRSALTDYGFADNMGPQDFVYHKDSWYMTFTIDGHQGEDFIAKFNFNEDFTAIKITEDAVINYDNNTYGLTSICSDGSDLWVTTGNFIFKLNDDCSIIGAYNKPSGLNAGGADYDSATNQLIIYSMQDNVYRWSPNI